MANSAVWFVLVVLHSIFVARGTCSTPQLDVTRDGTTVTLMCDQGGVLDPNAEYMSVDPKSGSTEIRNDQNTESGYQFEVTPETEVIARCMSMGSMSNEVRIAAIQEYTGPSRENQSVFLNEPGIIKCPFKLGLLHGILSPYEITWQRFDDGGIVPMDIPDTGRILRLPNITNDNSSDEYRCTLTVRLCSCGEQNHVTTGPRIGLRVVEQFRILTSPMNATRHEGENTTFHCNVEGNDTEIHWIVDGEEYNDDSTGDICVNSSTMEPQRPGSNRVKISSTLTIKPTFEMNSDILIQCRVSQEVNGLPNQIETHNATLSLPSIPLPISTTETSTTTDSTPQSTTTPVSPLDTSRGPLTKEYIYAIVGGAVAVIFVVILLLFGVCFLRYHYKYKAKTSRIGRSLRRTFSRDPSVRGQRSRRSEDTADNGNPLYDEVDPALFKGTTPEMSRQNGVPYAEDNAKAVDPTLFAVNNGNGHYPPLLHDPTAIDQIYNTSQRSGVSGISAYSGLSGVSQNVPGVYHKMPEFSEDSMTNLNLSQPPSDVNSSLLYPPHLTPERSLRTSEISGGSGAHTRTTSVHSGYFQTQDGVAYPHPALQGNYQLPPHCSSHSDHGIAPQVYPPGEPGLHNPHQFSSHPQLYWDQRSHSRTHSINSQGSGQHSPANMRYSPQMRSSPKLYGTPPIQQYEQQVVNDKTLLMVLNCLMHNKDCLIVGCPCRKVQERYRNLLAGCYPISTTPEQSRKTSNSVSTDSDSDPDPADKRSRLRLNLPDVDPQYPNIPNLHPHFHLTSKSHLRRVYPRQAPRPRSKSLSDLTPVIEVSETPAKTPMVGGSLVAGTPIRCPGTLGDSDSSQEASSPEFCEGKAPPLLREISLSADNLPALCLNGCPFTPSPLKTCRNLGSPVKSKRRRIVPKAVKPSLKTVQENSGSLETDGSNTSSRSPSPSEVHKSSQSDHEDDGIVTDFDSITSEKVKQSLTNGVRRTIMARGESSGYESFDGETHSGDNSANNSGRLSRKALYAKSRENHSLETSLKHCPNLPSSSESKGQTRQQRSPSPYETDTRRVQGITMMTTEC